MRESNFYIPGLNKSCRVEQARKIVSKLIAVPPVHPTATGAGRVVTMSTIAFTLLFAVWLMFGILGVPIQEEQIGRASCRERV